jgi:hypothetical protein
VFYVITVHGCFWPVGSSMSASLNNKPVLCW